MLYGNLRDHFHHGPGRDVRNRSNPTVFVDDPQKPGPVVIFKFGDRLCMDQESHLNCIPSMQREQVVVPTAT